MAETSDLKTEMTRWDGKSVGAITTIYALHRDDQDFCTTLIEACASSETECAATWLIKHHCENGHPDFTETDRRRLYGRLPRFEGWEAQLHVLQIVDVLHIPKAAAQEVFDYLQNAVASDRKLIRAWALYAAASLAQQHPSFRQDALSLLRDASDRAEPGAVAVRLRKALALLT